MPPNRKSSPEELFAAVESLPHRLDLARGSADLLLKLNESLEELQIELGEGEEVVSKHRDGVGLICLLDLEKADKVLRFTGKLKGNCQVSGRLRFHDAAPLVDAPCGALSDIPTVGAEVNGAAVTPTAAPGFLIK